MPALSVLSVKISLKYDLDVFSQFFCGKCFPVIIQERFFLAAAGAIMMLPIIMAAMFIIFQ